MKDTQGNALYIARAPLALHSQHFIPRWRTSAKCQGSGSCFLCDQQFKRQDLGVVPVSLPQSETIHLLRLTGSWSAMVQGLQTMGPSLQGLQLLLDVKNGRTLGVKTSGRTVTSFVPVENYLRAIGQKTYDRLLRLELLELNELKLDAG